MEEEISKFGHLFSQGVNMENFKLIRVIGRGSFAKVYLVKMIKQPSADRFRRQLS